jgi:hypothetical protein
VKWLADENFDNDILRGIRRRVAGFDVVRAQDVAEISGLDDPAVLAWATTNDRIVLTHDLSTMKPAMQEQVKRFASCSPIVFVRDSLPVSLHATLESDQFSSCESSGQSATSQSWTQGHYRVGAISKREW